MISRLLGLVGVTLLVGCGGGGSNPVTGGPLAGDTVDPTDPNTNPAEVYAFDLGAGLVMNSLSYDETADQLLINNIPFDSATNLYDRTGALPGGFGIYENDERALPGRQDFFAVFQRSASGNSQAGAVATGDFQGFGNGGATAQRLNVTLSLPSSGILAYAGQYAGVYVLGDQNMGRNDVQLVTGDAQVTIDFDDFDVTGAVIGFVNNRVLYDNTGMMIGNLSTVGFGETGYDPATGAIAEGGASSTDGLLSGNWQGVIAGPNGEEIAATLVLTGTTPDPDPLDPLVNGNTVREIGALIVTQ